MEFLPAVFLILGILIGFAAGFLALRGKLKLERAQGKAEGDVQIAALKSELLTLDRRQQELGAKMQEDQKQILELTRMNADLQARLEGERSQGQAGRERLTLEFKQLADAILEEKSKKFTEQNKTNMEGILNPLGTKIKEFEKKVQDTYEKEREQVTILSRDIEKLKETSLKMSVDAVNLTNALKGDSKQQGNLGEVILERVLEKSGLVKDREYRIQVSLSGEDGRRYQPDVIVDLPENKHIVIDSKVSLTAYSRYFASEDKAAREGALKEHVTSIRKHLDGLSLKSYQTLYQLQSLDFVFLFMPIEPALILAVQNDLDLFQDAFDKNIVIVSPSTLLATLRTISSIWRQENQNRNSAEIARQAGLMYDKFVGFLEDLNKVGNSLAAAQGSFEDARSKLSSGRGNLIGKAQKLKQLDAKTSKAIPEIMLPSGAVGMDFGEADGANEDAE